jgi:hypothetical protein
LFVDEVPFDRPARGSSSFAERFAALGPRDSKGRSLRDLSLEQRMFQYPCSYLIYSPAFDGLPPHARDLVYRRLWAILSGQDQDPKYRVLSAADRRAIVEILHDTKSGLPDYFKG